MSFPLPEKDFKWIDLYDIMLMEEEGFDKFIKRIPQDGKTGLMMEVDLEIDPAHHDLFNDYPPSSREALCERGRDVCWIPATTQN
jgi:hypothetical protein